MTSVLPPRYVLDTSLFTQAKRSYYAFDIAQGFWKHLVKSAKQGLITSIDKVYDEIERGKDDLYVWIKQNLSAQFFRDIDNSSDVLINYQKLINWSSSKGEGVTSLIFNIDFIKSKVDRDQGKKLISLANNLQLQTILP